MFKQRLYFSFGLLILTASFFSFLNAQSLIESNIENVNPVVLFEKSKELIFQKKYVEAKTILKPLAEKFPNDFEIRGLYLETIIKTEDVKTTLPESEKVLEILKKIPVQERTESFYENFKRAAFGARKFKEAFTIYDEWGQKFPKSLRGRLYRSKNALDEKDILKRASLIKELIKESEGQDDVKFHYHDYFVTVSENPEKFEKREVVLTADILEKLHLKNLNEQSDSTAQTLYFQNILEISEKLRKNFPFESLKFAEKGLSLFESRKIENELKDYKLIFEVAVFRSYAAANNWKTAYQKGKFLIERLEISTPDKNINEAELRRDYANVLENLKMISSAREQMFLASFLDKKFQTDWKNFDSKYSLSANRKTGFEKSVRQKFDKFLASRESVIKANFLKSEKKIPANDFVIQDLNGKKVALKDLRGKIVILDFWATWCAPCISELEELKVAYKKYTGNPQIVFLSVSTDSEKEKVPVAVRERNYDFPVYYAGENLEKDYKIDAIPKIFIIDAEGNIRFEKSDYLDNGYYLKELDWMIEAAMK